MHGPLGGTTIGRGRGAAGVWARAWGVARAWVVWAALAAVFLDVGPGRAWAQEGDPNATTTSTTGGGSPTTGAGTGTFVGEVQVQLEFFGLANQARRGDWCGIRLKLMDSASKQRNVLVRLISADADGDRPEHERVLTLNPGVWQGVWLYTRLPFAIEPDRDMVATVHEAIEDAGAPGGVQAGRLLARSAIVPNGNALVEPGLSMFGIMGSAKYGLERYTFRVGRTSQDHWGPYSHEAGVMLSGLTPELMPDHYAGLASLEYLVWGAGEPASLRGDRAAALRHWVARGGHLVIILPPVGQTWVTEASNELADLLPAVTIARREGVDLREYRPLFNLDAGLSLPSKDAVVHTFSPKPDARQGEAMKILCGPDGACVVVRRLVGLGAVTLIGLDLNRPPLVQGASLDAQTFWHRVLGKRGDMPRTLDANAGNFSTARSPFDVDVDLAYDIAKTGHSAIGVTLGFIIFGLYWLVAGPLGYAALKKAGHTRHAWVGFLVVGALFTALAWGGATLIRPRRVEAAHVTFLDHVYGQDTQRARAWLGLLLPSYGSSTIQVGDPEQAKFDTQAGSSANLITPWEAGDRSSWVNFPDARTYAIDGRRSDALTVPTRATVKQFRVDWAGGPTWKMPIPLDYLTLHESPPPQQPLVTGRLRHDLPGTLNDVRVIVVQGQTSLPLAREAIDPSADKPKAPEMTARGWVYTQPRWLPGEELDLGVLTLIGGAQRTALTTFLDDLTPTTPSFGFDSAKPDASKSTSRMYAAALFDYLQPMDSKSTVTSKDAAGRRANAHGWSVTRWFTQPCIIVLGQLGDRAGTSEATGLPMPMFVDGKPLEAEGRTVVRWIYPLPDAPPPTPKKEEAGTLGGTGK